MLTEHTSNFAKHFSLSCAKEGDLAFLISIDPETILRFDSLSPGFCLSAKICNLPTEKQEELFLFLMSANFLAQGTSGGVIQLDPEEKFLTLSTTFTYDMNYKAFTEAVEEFINYLDYWRIEIRRKQKEQEQSIFS